jgi:hypothetical protein
MGAKLGPFGVGDEIGVVEIEKVAGWEPLLWRQERPWAAGPRQGCVPRHAWGATVLSSDGEGGLIQHFCVLQVAVSPDERTKANALADLYTAGDAAAHAHRFNCAMARTCTDCEASSMPGIKVCAPVACTVLGGTASDFARPGETVLLTCYPARSVQKFVFDGSEEFLELPQAFFHYAMHSSGGQEQLADLQGVEDGDDVLLLDPLVLRASEPRVVESMAVVCKRFDTWHPRCGPMCRVFDPQRKARECKRHCGLNVESCGIVAGGG